MRKPSNSQVKEIWETLDAILTLSPIVIEISGLQPGVNMLDEFTSAWAFSPYWKDWGDTTWAPLPSTVTPWAWKSLLTFSGDP